LVELHEAHLGMHGHGVCEVRTSTAKYRKLRALDIDFEKIEGSDLGNIVEAMRLHRQLPGHHSENRIEREAVENFRIGREQTAHARSVTHLQRRQRSIAHGIGQIGFKIALEFIQLRKTFELRLETDKGAETLAEHRLVRRNIGNWIGAYIDDGGEAVGLQ